MLKKIIPIAISAIVVSFFVGCSNQSPLSIDDGSDRIEKVASFYDAQASDISCAWGLHFTQFFG
jgi:hypothetical protein